MTADEMRIEYGDENRRFFLKHCDCFSFPHRKAGCAVVGTMDIFFKGTITSSPIKTRNTQGQQPSYSFDTSFLSDAAYECFATSPETGLVHVCRRSPRLLANGYYVLTEDSIVTDDQGNLTLTPTQTNVSYKENLARIFRRRPKAKRSFATLFNDVSQSLLNGDSTKVVPLKGQESILPEVESLSEDCSAPVLCAQSLNSLVDVPSQSKCYCIPTNPPSDAVFRKAFLVLLFTLCLCASMFSRYVCGGIAVAAAFLFLISSIRGSKSGTMHTIWTKTEDITSRNE
ncbi:transmembrane protein 71 [Neoarius graeffei]|uniref:transmembrane protein 71 n=1 Tax=Neoarius graeffei TaxID=443677 RepID=UPI00298CD859|nr:transmembrane protein 71 [Neoarius graeffei]